MSPTIHVLAYHRHTTCKKCKLKRNNTVVLIYDDGRQVIPTLTKLSLS